MIRHQHDPQLRPSCGSLLLRAGQVLPVAGSTGDGRSCSFASEELKGGEACRNGSSFAPPSPAAAEGYQSFLAQPLEYLPGPNARTVMAVQSVSQGSATGPLVPE